MLSRIFLRFLLLCGLTVLLVAGLAAYVKLMQPQPIPGAPLSASVNHPLLWPWQWGEGAELAVSFTPPPAAGPEVNLVRDLVLVMDTSGSMLGKPLDEAKQAAAAFLDNMDLGRTGGSVAVVEFGEKANVMAPLGKDIARAREVILNGLQIEPGADTLLIPALSKALDELESKGAKGATVLLLTDGQVEDPKVLRNFYETQWRPKGHALFLLGAGEAVVRSSLEALADDPAVYLLTSVDKQSPQAMFEEVAQRLRSQLGRAARLATPWAAPLVEPAAPQGGQAGCDALPASNSYALPPLFARERPYCWSAAFRPRLGGVLKVLHSPANLEYIDNQGRLQSVRSQSASPLVLAVPWWILLPLLLYPLGEWLAHLLSPPKPQPQTIPTHHSRPTALPPPLLPRRGIDPGLRIEWIPTLVVGLGGGGRQVLTHIAQSLRDACQEPGEAPLLLALDVARKEPAQVQACLEALPANALFFLPETACRLQNQVLKDADPAAPAAALDLAPYRDWTAEQLGLGLGTQGQGPLARLALLNDLAAGESDGLLSRLRTELDAWRALGGASARRQLLLVGNAEGGITRGWLADLLILLRRLTAGDERAGVAVDISVLLLGQADVGEKRFHPLRSEQSALFDELDRLACAGRLPFRHGWAGSGVLAEAWERRRPQDAVFVMAALPEDWQCQLYPNAAAALLLLADNRRRLDLAGLLESLGAEEASRRIREGKESFTEIDLRSAAFPHSFRRRQIELLLLVRLLGDRGLSPGLASTGTELPADAAAALVDASEQAGNGPENALLALAAGQGGAKPGKFKDVRHLLLPRLQTEWSEHLRAGRWNLATLASCARSVALNLRGGGQDIEDLAQDLDGLAEQAVEWIALLLGASAARRTADQAGIHGPAADRLGALPEAASACRAVEERYAEWRANPTRLSALPSQDDGDGLLDAWLQTWLGPVADRDQELRRRCHFELAVPGPGGKGVGLRLAFTGTSADGFAVGEWSKFIEALRREIGLSLWPDMRRQFLEALGGQSGGDPAKAAADFALRLKAGLRGDQATLLVSMPGREAAPGEQADRVRQALRAALTQNAGADEILRFHEASDPFRFLLWRLQPLKESRPREDNPQMPVHFCERRRTDYGKTLARELGLARLRLPGAAGLALADSERLTAFAGLWLAGRIRRDESTGLWRLRDPEGTTLALSYFPEEGLAEAAARFVADGHDTPPPLDVADRRPDPAANPFENLLCWLWQQRRRIPIN